MAAEIQRDDLISDDALMAPLVLNRNFETLYDTMIKLKTEFGQNAAFAKQATTINAVGTSIDKLVTSEKEMVKIQNQLATAVAKDTQEYAEMKKKVDEANASARTRIQLGEQDAKTVNAQNASMKQLEAALIKNRQAYAALSNEQARSSKEGKNLLSTIQSQDKEFKKLKVSIGQHQDNVGNYTQAMQGLDGVMGGTIGRLKMLGEQLLALAKNPIVLILGTLVGLFVALKSSVNAYFETTAEGEERLSRQKATWDAFFLTLKQGWADVGKSVFDFFGDDGLKGLFDTFLLMYFPSLWARFQVTEERSQKLNATLRKLTKDHAADVVDDANTELRANKLIEISRNKLDYSAVQRLAALKEHNRIKEEQLQGDIQLAKDDLAAFDQRIKLERKNGELTLADITERAKLEAALIKVQSDASSARTGFLKLEKGLVDEIHKDRMDALQAEFDKEMSDKQAKVDAAIAAVQQEVIEGKKIKADGDKEIANIRKSIADDLIQAQIDGLNKLLLSEELTAEERAAIEVRLAKLKVDLQNAIYDQVITLDEATVKSGKSTIEKLQDIYTDFANAINSLFTSNSDARIQSIDDEIAKLEEKTERSLELAGEDEATKKQIELAAEARREQLEKKKKADQNKQARAQKVGALIEAAINTSVAITKALPNIPLSILTGVLGAIQVAAIAAKPIPQYFKGVDSSPEGVALVGEQGRELKIEPSGKMSLTPGVPTLDYLKAGTQIIPHKETMRALALSGLGSDVLMQREQSQQIDLAKSLNKIEKNTRKIGRSSGGNLYAQGILTYEQKIKEDGSKQHIRKSALGK